MTDAVDKAKQLSRSLLGQVAIQTFQGMMPALVTWTAQLLPLMWLRLQILRQQVGGDHYRIGQWLPLAVDGSRFSTPRKKSNERAFAAANFGKGKKTKSSRYRRSDKNEPIASKPIVKQATTRQKRVYCELLKSA